MTFTQQIWKYHSLLLIPAILSFIVAGYLYSLYLNFGVSVVVSLIGYVLGLSTISLAEKIAFSFFGMTCSLVCMGLVFMRITRQILRGISNGVVKTPILNSIAILILDIAVIYFLTTAGMSLQRHEYVGFAYHLFFGIILMLGMLFVYLAKPKDIGCNSAPYKVES